MAANEKVIEIKVPIHSWLVKRAAYDPGLRTVLERELGRQAFDAARQAKR